MYYNYGGKGIECRLTHQEVKRLWERDEAWKLDRPSLDRVDPAKHYTFENCRFIELEENISRGSVARSVPKPGRDTRRAFA